MLICKILVGKEDNMLAKELNIYEIICRKFKYADNEELYKDEELYNIYKGEKKAYIEMLEDISIMNENEFIEKYLLKLKSIEMDKCYKNVQNDVLFIMETRGYNYGVIYVLTLLNPEYVKLLDIYV